MKQKTITLLLALSLPTICFAQLKVDSLGHVGILCETSPLNALNVNGNIHISGNVVLDAERNSLKINSISEDTLTDSQLAMSLWVDNQLKSTKNTVGLYSRAKGIKNAQSTIGILAYSGSDKPLKSIGIYGIARPVNNSAAIYGKIDSSINLTTNYNGNYAGFFDGNVKVTGTITGTLISDSDGNLKENIASIGDGEEYSLAKLSLLNPVSYQYKQVEQKDEKIGELDVQNKEGQEDEQAYLEYQRKLAKKTHFGFIAQDLQKIYPELVYEQENGSLAVNYVELIPVLVQSIKELNEKVETLSTAQKQKAPTNGETAYIQKEDIFDMSSMGQNTPNPFSERTEIAITLPESVKKAMLYIYDMTGKQMEQHEITGRGNTSMTIYADRMNAGMYIYALVADGKVITSKKMIVTK